MVLALNNLQGLICHKNQPTNPPTKQTKVKTSISDLTGLVSLFKGISAIVGYLMPQTFL